MSSFFCWLICRVPHKNPTQSSRDHFPCLYFPPSALLRIQDSICVASLRWLWRPGRCDHGPGSQAAPRGGAESDFAVLPPSVPFPISSAIPPWRHRRPTSQRYALPPSDTTFDISVNSVSGSRRLGLTKLPPSRRYVTCCLKAPTQLRLILCLRKTENAVGIHLLVLHCDWCCSLSS